MNVTIFGRTSGGEYKPVLVDDGGTVQTSAAGGGVAGTVAVSGTVSTLERGGTTVVSSLPAISGTVSIAGTIPTKEVRSTAVPALTTVAGTTASGTILAGNANRLGATVYNRSSAELYLLLGTAAASSSQFTLVMAGTSYYEVPFAYTGQLMGAWSANAGSAHVTELT